MLKLLLTVSLLVSVIFAQSLSLNHHPTIPAIDISKCSIFFLSGKILIYVEKYKKYDTTPCALHRMKWGLVGEEVTHLSLPTPQTYPYPGHTHPRTRDTHPLKRTWDKRYPPSEKDMGPEIPTHLPHGHND